MSDPQLPPVVPSASRLTRALLVVSLALNLAILGLVGGAMLRGPGEGGPGGNVVRDLGFGLFTEALTPQDKKALRERFVERNPGFRQERRAMRSDLDAILAALRAVPFDPAALDAVLAAQKARLTDRVDLGQALIRDYLVELSPEARAGFADRLEERLTRGRP